MTEGPSALGPGGSTSEELSTAVRAALVVALLYLFLTGVELLSGGFKTMGAGFVDGLFEGVSNPVGGLFVGLLAGLYPAWLITRTNPIDALRDIARKGGK